MRRWRLCATLALILPEAVRLKRFFAPLLVLSLGISVLSRRRLVTGGKACPQAPRRREPLHRRKARVIPAAAAQGKRPCQSARRGAPTGCDIWSGGSALAADLTGIGIDQHPELLATLLHCRGEIVP